MEPLPPTEPQVTPPARRHGGCLALHRVLRLGHAAVRRRLDTLAGDFSPLRIARDTTCLTGPINPDGTVNYVAALNDMLSKGVTRENNAALPLLQALGPEMINPPRLRLTVLKQLDVEALPEEGECFVTLAEHLKHQQAGRSRTLEPGEGLRMMSPVVC